MEKIKGKINLADKYGMCSCASFVGIEETIIPIKGLIFIGCGNCLDSRIKLYFMDKQCE